MGYDSRDYGKDVQTAAVTTVPLSTKGVLGTVSKIQEELDELKEAERLQDPVNQLVELRDIIGACALYLEQRYPKVDFINLCKSALSMNKSKAKGIGK